MAAAGHRPATYGPEMTSRVRRPGCLLALIATAVLLLGVAAMGVRWWVTSTLISELVSHHSSQATPAPASPPRLTRQPQPGCAVTNELTIRPA